MGRPKLVVGNWKMNGDTAQAEALLSLLIQPIAAMSKAVSSNKSNLGDFQVAVCPAHPYLGLVGAQLASSTIALGAQNCAQTSGGAFTGETSAAMLANLKCTFVIVGHSERRALFGDTDSVIALKIARCLEAGLKPIVCVGETLAEREAGQFAQVIGSQLNAALAVLPKEVNRFVVAYEPVWAIGTGKTASPEQAQEVHALIRSQLSAAGFPAQEIAILYGGSVKGSNAASLFSQTDIDGGLIGGAALVAEEFIAICSALQ
jgi:triosephosphate isomerase (TIM)